MMFKGCELFSCRMNVDIPVVRLTMIDVGNDSTVSNHGWIILMRH